MDGSILCSIHLDGFIHTLSSIRLNLLNGYGAILTYKKVIRTLDILLLHLLAFEMVCLTPLDPLS
jgi:hypothetical protein